MKKWNKKSPRFWIARLVLMALMPVGLAMWVLGFALGLWWCFFDAGRIYASSAAFLGQTKTD